MVYFLLNLNLLFQALVILGLLRWELFQLVKLLINFKTKVFSSVLNILSFILTIKTFISSLILKKIPISDFKTYERPLNPALDDSKFDASKFF